MWFVLGWGLLVLCAWCDCVFHLCRATANCIFCCVRARYAFKAGTDLMVEGAPGDLFFVLVKGVAEVWLGDKRVHEFKERGAFGELALLNDAPRSATVCAETDVVRERESARRQH